MKREIVFILLLLCTGTVNYGQKIQYSKGTFRYDKPYQTNLIPVEDYYHLITFQENKKPFITVFNAQLQLIYKKEIDFTFQRASDIRIIPFSDYYLLYIHILRTPQHKLWKISRDGTITSLSGKFQRLVDSFFWKTNTTLDLISDKDSFYVMAHTYYDTAKNVRNIIAHLDRDLNPLFFFKSVYPFEIRSDILWQVAFTRGSLYVLKTSENEAGYFLDIFKTDIHTGKTANISFNSPSHAYFNVGLRLDTMDSSLLVYALVKQSIERVGMSRTIFVTRLDTALREKAPLMLLKSEFTKNIISDFVLVEGAQPLWFNIYEEGKRLSEVVGADAQKIRKWGAYFYSDHAGYYDNLSGVRFTILDEQLRKKSDSTVGNKKIIEVELFPYAFATLDSTAYLVLIQNYDRKHHALVMITANKSGGFSIFPIPVYDRYKYLLLQLRTTNDGSFVVPFTYKDEMGLMKVKLKEGKDFSLKE